MLLKSNILFMGSFGNSIYTILSFLNTESFVYSFYTFYLFSYPTALDRTSRAMLNRSGKGGHPHLISDLWGKKMKGLIFHH